MPDRIAKTLSVPIPPLRAFTMWVERINDWWPKNHTRGGDPDTTIVLESRSEGRVYARTPGGIEHEMGRVTGCHAGHGRGHLTQALAPKSTSM